MKDVKILIVEDEILIAEDISMSLLKAGYKVVSAGDSDEARAEFQKESPDIIIMDINLNGSMDGIETARAIRQTDQDVPIIFLSAFNDESTAKRAFSVDPAAYLLKPFNERQVLISIEQALHNISEKQPVVINDVKSSGERHEFLLNDCLFVRKTNETAFKKILVKDILYLKASRAYCEIFIDNESPYVQASSMNVVHEHIANPSFVQVHRSYVVNLEKINEINGNMLSIGTEKIPIGENFRNDLIKRLPMLR